MDPKEVKALLKEAKDGIKSKDYAGAAAKCKIILRKEPDNYQANLYLGTAMKEQGKWQQAIESYKKATEIDPKQIYAWQGIILTYEKQGIKNHKDLLDAYKVAATHFEKDDKARYIESTKKLMHGLIAQEDKKGALKIINRLTKEVGMEVDVAEIVVQQLLVGTKYEGRSEMENQVYTEALASLVTSSNNLSNDTCNKYFTQLNRVRNYAQVIEVGLLMREKWNTYSSPMEWLCRFYMEERLDDGSLKEIGPFDALTDKLFKLHPSSTWGHFARGKFYIEAGVNMNDGFAFITTGLESKSEFRALYCMVKGRLEYGDYEGAVDDCVEGIRNFSKDADICNKLRLCLAEAWIWLEIEKAEEMLENIKGSISEDKKWWWAILNCKLCAKKTDIAGIKANLSLAQEKGTGHWALDLYRILSSVDLDNPESLKSSIDVQLTHIPSEKDRISCTVESAMILFNFKHYKEAAELLVSLTKNEMGRKRPQAWKYLGHLYKLQEDMELAAKCYKKSYKLCPEGDVGSILSDVYFTLEKDEANRELLIGATKGFIRLKSKWAWLRLGILYLHSGEANEAVKALQAAIRADITDCHVWESLADAYFLRGSYTAALNSYNKALELGADTLYNKLKIGVVYQCLGYHDKSVLTLKTLLEEYPENSTPVSLELARTSSLIAREMAMENFDVRAKAAVEESLVYCVLAVLTSSKRILLPWLVIGESALTLNNIPNESLVKIPTFLQGANPELYFRSGLKVEDFEYANVSVDELRQISIQALLESLKIIDTPDDGITFSKYLHAYVYHQLAILYFNRARHCTTTNKENTDDGSSDLLKKAVVAAKKAVVYHQTQYIYWNSLGIISSFAGNDELAQHAFIKSVENEGNNVTAWCNLGILALRHSQELLAHELFKKAQSISPLHSFSWIGQAMVAEKLQPIEAPDLFRHAAHLEPSTFGISCYTDWVCRILLSEFRLSANDYWYNIGRVDALTIVNDLITRIEVRHQTPQLFNMKGIIAAFNGFYETALDSFEHALQLAQNHPKVPVSEEEIKQMLFNKISMLVKLGRYEEAVGPFSTVEDLDPVGLAVGALITSKMGYLEQSEGLYNQLLQNLVPTDESSKMDVTLALGLIANKLKGPQDACSVLLQEFMVKSPHGLLALSAIGILNSDSDFVGNVIPHLEPFLESDPSLIPDIGLMKACFHIMKNNPKLGTNELLKLIRLHPWNPRLWSFLGKIIFHHQFESIHSLTFQRITMTALKLSNTRIDPLRNKDAFVSPSAMLSLCHLMNDDWKTAVLTALKGLRKYPWQRENWILLACAYWYKYSEDQRNVNAYNKSIELLVRELTIGHINQRATDWSRAFLDLVKQHKPT